MPLNSEFDTVEEYISNAVAMGRRPSTIENYRYVLGALAEWRDSADDLSTLTRNEARAWLRELNAVYSPGGNAARLRVAKAYFNWLVAEELCEANPFKGLSIRLPDDPQPIATDDQVAAMLKRARRGRNPKRDVALITLLADTGARKGEVGALEARDIDLRSGTVTFRVSKTKPRTTPLTDEAVKALGCWMRERGDGRKLVRKRGAARWVRETAEGGSLWNVQNPYDLVKQVVQRHSRGELTPHQLRRKFAVDWLMAGGSEVGLMRVAGWSSRDMIQLYVAAQADQLAADEFRRLLG